ncbi:MAG: thermonuclease family protein [Actinomycetota bacterium]
MKSNWLWMLAWVLPLPAAADLIGRVAEVNEGDALTVVVNGREQMRVRLLGIDAPESYQDFAGQAKSNLGALVSGRDVRLADVQKDRFGRTWARVWVSGADCVQATCPQTVDVGLAQVAAGWAWHDPQQSKEWPSADRQRYSEAEFMAKVRRLGLWAGKSPVAPWAAKQHRLVE